MCHIPFTIPGLDLMTCCPGHDRPPNCNLPSSTKVQAAPRVSSRDVIIHIGICRIKVLITAGSDTGLAPTRWPGRFLHLRPLTCPTAPPSKRGGRRCGPPAKCHPAAAVKVNSWHFSFLRKWAIVSQGYILACVLFPV